MQYKQDFHKIVTRFIKARFISKSALGTIVNIFKSCQGILEKTSQPTFDCTTVAFVPVKSGPGPFATLLVRDSDQYLSQLNPRHNTDAEGLLEHSMNSYALLTTCERSLLKIFKLGVLLVWVIVCETTHFTKGKPTLPLLGSSTLYG